MRVLVIQAATNDRQRDDGPQSKYSGESLVGRTTKPIDELNQFEARSTALPRLQPRSKYPEQRNTSRGGDVPVANRLTHLSTVRHAKFQAHLCVTDSDISRRNRSHKTGKAYVRWHDLE